MSLDLTVTDLPERLAFRIVIAQNGCWEWLGWHNDKGYGYVRWEGRDQPVHRVIMSIVRGEPIPRVLDVDHICRNVGCCRPHPSHLEVVTHQVNIKRGVAGQKTSCNYGHDWTDPKNVRIRRNGRRYCAECDRQSCRKRYALRVAA